jgi:hypothetical protein
MGFGDIANKAIRESIELESLLTEGLELVQEMRKLPALSKRSGMTIGTLVRIIRGEEITATQRNLLKQHLIPMLEEIAKD